MRINNRQTVAELLSLAAGIMAAVAWLAAVAVAQTAADAPGAAPAATRAATGAPTSTLPGAPTVAPASVPARAVEDEDLETEAIREVDPENPFAPLAAPRGEAMPNLIREGKRLLDREGALVRQGNQTLLSFDGGRQGLMLVSNKTLERMEDLSGFGRRGLKFKVSGVIYEYRGRNYLRITSNFQAIIDQAAGQAAATSAAGTSTAATPTAALPAAPAASTPPATPAPLGGSGSPPPSPVPVTPNHGAPSLPGGALPNPTQPQDGDRDRPPMPTEIAVPPVPAPPATADEALAPAPPVPEAAAPGKLMTEDKRLVDREGRMIRAGQQSVFVFDAGDQPMILLPNKKLEYMENLADWGRREVRFRISGLVTEYRGCNYLVMTKLIVVPKAIEKL